MWPLVASIVILKEMPYAPSELRIGAGDRYQHYKFVQCMMPIKDHPHIGSKLTPWEGDGGEVFPLPWAESEGLGITLWHMSPRLLLVLPGKSKQVLGWPVYRDTKYRSITMKYVAEAGTLVIIVAGFCDWGTSYHMVIYEPQVVQESKNGISLLVHLWFLNWKNGGIAEEVHLRRTHTHTHQLKVCLY